MDAIECLRLDHQKIRNLFVRLRSSDDFETIKEVFDKIQDELELHLHLEETIFYPSFLGLDALQGWLNDFFQEHRIISDMLDDLKTTIHRDTERFLENLEELMETVEFHLNKEDKEFFVRVRSHLSINDLDGLAARMNNFKERSIAA